MWNSFLLCALIILTALYLPGYLFFRALRLSRLFAFGCAPLYTLALYAALPIVYEKCGIFCNWAILVLPALLLAIALLLVFNRQGNQEYGNPCIDRPWLILCLYLAMGLAACWFILVSGLGDFDTFYNRHDNSTHLNAIRAFIDSGNWSSMGMNVYLTSPDNAQPFDSSAVFYPSAWHDVVALAVSVFNCPVDVGVNAFNAVITGIVYPLSMYLLMLHLNKGDRLAILAGAFVTPAFNAFPWYFFLKGPLVGNMLSYAIVPAVCAAFIALCKAARKSAGFIVTFCVVALIACIALGLSQPNGLFTFYIFAAAFLGHKLYRLLKRKYREKRLSRVQCVMLFGGFVLLVVFLWFVAYKIPTFKSVVNFRYKSDNGLDPFNTLYDVLSLGLVLSFPQWLLVALAFAGILALLAKKRPWHIVPPAFFAVAYFFARAFYEKAPRQYIAGFWYSDPTRLAGGLTIFLTPIVSLGLAMTLRLVVRLVKSLASSAGLVELDEKARAAIVVACLAAFSCYAYFPNFTPNIWEKDNVTPTPIGIVKMRISNEYDTAREQVYSADERAFVQKVKEVIPEGALVINQPQDGSVFAYGLDGLNTYFRSAGSFDYSATADAIRQGMDKITLDDDVRNAVASTGAEYLLLLDEGVPYDEGKWLTTYHEGYVPLWAGLNNVTDETPGLELVLSEGDDMRLYKITATEDEGAAQAADAQ